ncbi:isoprenylcysteine carboxylmethyltransferase family protein [Sulfurospirillum diekertiae]|uniref:Isoprenylcysteine carboxylmethyltransferase family protein n=1 Tax=Sulfurospirillum diekertiae TaxID=1854492 RepID=A0A858KGM9_9BACT|nr:isoprenylcysteine carboxylmethyltransferase family protein [Sulfurospirillum diekertiae]QIR76972.2 isoprenylcysteine carboxylmethyltransferase family protein [Sulfurospirillum diekertiae]QIR79588.2 isoprenylcysteine carboxylmethyltransferase family protein [Sulfurospirillum diekertiae]
MKSQTYSYLLVSLQFIFIAILLIEHGLHIPSNFALFIFLLGCGFGLYTVRHNPLGNFNITPEIKENASLITTGAYRYIRHPMYFSVLLMMLGIVVSQPAILSLFIYMLLVVTLFLKAQKEEMLWIKQSCEYQNYRQKTKRIIPFVL